MEPAWGWEGIAGYLRSMRSKVRLQKSWKGKVDREADQTRLLWDGVQGGEILEGRGQVKCDLGSPAGYVGIIILLLDWDVEVGKVERGKLGDNFSDLTLIRVTALLS